MRLFLVRHGETVDNVAGIYAGTRDSPLTAHGALQARRLGAHLAARSAVIGPIRHIFSSDLRRAVETAQAVVDAQAPLVKIDGVPDADADADADGVTRPLPLRLVQLPELRERYFGSAEGERYGAPHADAESHEEMRSRAERFVLGHLAPVLAGQGAGAEGVIVVVAHGLILNSLLRVLLSRYGPEEMTRLAKSGTGRAGYLASWSNTGYVEAVVEVNPVPPPVVDGSDAPSASAAVVSGERMPQPQPQPQQKRISLSVVGVNVLKHLEGLKRTRGGIGSAQFDKRQRTMDTFFGPAAKKPRIERELGDA
ncbi:hypothetical protein VTK56DRAFT_2702 [Thermocarpiscus australiensis]